MAAEPKTTWMVRAGEGGMFADEFKNKSCVVIGWSELGDVPVGVTRDRLAEITLQANPDWSPGHIGQSVGQVFKFINEMKVGDRVMTAIGATRTYLVGIVTGNYEYKPNYVGEMPRVRGVRWEATIKRDDLTPSTKYALGALLTVFQVMQEAASEIENVIAGTKPEPNGGDKGRKIPEYEQLLQDVISRANEFIEDIVLKLNWEQMQALVAGILRAMGYKTRVSPKGGDLGKDIIASPDGLGLEEPHIVVEVKHRPTTMMGAPDLRSFIGGLHERDRGLYVSTGGFTKEAHYEAARSNPSIALIDLDGLIELIVQYYEQLDGDTRALVPLVKVYWPSTGG